jgi:hypothetical protein
LRWRKVSHRSGEPNLQQATVHNAPTQQACTLDEHHLSIASKSTPSYVVATTTFHGPDDLTVTEGSIRAADDAVVKTHPAMFRPVAYAVD